MPLTATDNIAPPIPTTGRQNDPGQYIRCPIPPIGLGPTDNLRQFYNNGLVPQFRAQMLSTALPGPRSTGSVTETVNVTAPGASSGGGSGGGSTTNGIFTTSITSPSLSPNQNYSGTILLARTYIVLNVAVSTAARIRLYINKTLQTNDLMRNTSTPVTLGLMNGIVGDWLLQSSSEFNWSCSPAPVGFNADSPSDSAAYITISNPASSSNIIQVTLTYATLET